MSATKLSTRVRRFSASRDSSPAASSTCREASPVSVAASVTCVMLAETSPVPWAAGGPFMRLPSHALLPPRQWAGHAFLCLSPQPIAKRRGIVITSAPPKTATQSASGRGTGQKVRATTRQLRRTYAEEEGDGTFRL